MEWKPVTIFMLVIAALAAMSLGNYLGYKFRAGRIAIILASCCHGGYHRVCCLCRRYPYLKESLVSPWSL